MKKCITLYLSIVFLAASMVVSAQFINIPSHITNPINTLIKYDNHIFVGSNSDILKITLYDLNGKVLYIKENFSPNLLKYSIDFSNIYFNTNSIYLLKIDTKNKSFSKIIRHE